MDVPALRAGVPAHKRVVCQHLAAPRSRQRADCAQVLEQVPEAGNSMLDRFDFERGRHEGEPA